jgi:crotonobetainyl-CoA:carnitine CoA-transferase CaiB-like acyl-CoA transferase
MTNDLLGGIRVLDFTTAAVGPFCSRILADLGADVIHVEFPRARWAAAGTGRDARFTPETLQTSGGILFLHCNGGKSSLAVNLKDPRGVRIIWDMIPTTDVVVENFTPRVMQGLGLGYAALSEINPLLVMCSLTGFGQHGLDGDTGRTCTDPIAQAMSGLNWITGERDGPPYAIGGGLGDTITAMTGATAILAALVHRQQSGRGQHIDLSMVEACAYLDCTVLPSVAANNGVNRYFRNGQQNSYTFPMGPFKATGGYISIQAPGAGPDSPWGRLCTLMGREDLLADERLRDDTSRLNHSQEVIGYVETWLCSLSSREEGLALLGAARISSGPVLSQEEMLEYPLYQRRGTFGTVAYPGLGDVGVVEPPFKFSDARAFVRGRAPEMGEHTRAILASRLGKSDAEIDGLIQSGVLYERAAAPTETAMVSPARQP